MKYRSLFGCYYCDCDDVSGFVCSECEVNKCEECVSRMETYEGMCVECLQDSFGFPNTAGVIRIVSSLGQGGGARILYIEASNLQKAFNQALNVIRRTMPGTHSAEIVIRIDQPFTRTAKR